MRTLALLFVTCGWMTCAGQQTSAIAARCLERLKLPDYPPLPLMARFQGEVVIDVHVSENLKFNEMEIQGKPHPLLVGAVWKALRKSRFAPACSGQRIRLSFVFLIEGEETKSPRAPTHYVSYPNRFWIVAQPVQFQDQP